MEVVVIKNTPGGFALLTQEELRKIFHYNPETGDLTWARRDRSQFPTEHGFKVFSGQRPGTPAGAVSAHGYLIVRVSGVQYMAHRLIWVYMTGEAPETIDHINHDRLDNRFRNLRSTSMAHNGKNQSLRQCNTSGATGIIFDKRSQRWQSVIRVNGKNRHCGYHLTQFDALAARRKAQNEYGYHPNHGM